MNDQIGQRIAGRARELLGVSEMSGPAGALDSADVDEDVLAAVVGLNETEALLGVEPLNSASRHSTFLS